MSVKQLLQAVFDADRALREAEQTLLTESEDDALARALEQAVEQAYGLDDEEGAARLTRIADLCVQVQVARTADTLVRILNHGSPEVRVAAGEALRDFAYDRYAEVARAVERAYQQQLEGPALSEIPWILAEIGEPSALPLIGRALKHNDPDVVASGVEALAELGDPAAVPLLEPLTSDRRVVQLEEGEAAYSTTIAELASEAISELEAG
ncbi:MAG: HEAT repeat domain-containing protein [Polyangiales bacterium]